MTDPEIEVANYFKEKDLWWKFEFPVFVYDTDGRERLYTPDFYIQKLGLFIEVCGREDVDYEYRKQVYEKNGIPVVFLHYYKKRRIWKTFLAKRVMEIEQQRKSEANKLTDRRKT
jgi:hypothetical protein